MGTISDKLEYLADTKEQIREGLNNLGAGIQTSDTFRSYANAIDEIYDSMPKVEENDVTSATLNGTIKGVSLSDGKIEILDPQKQVSMNMICFFFTGAIRRSST